MLIIMHDVLIRDILCIQSIISEQYLRYYISLLFIRPIRKI